MSEPESELELELGKTVTNIRKLMKVNHRYKITKKHPDKEIFLNPHTRLERSTDTVDTTYVKDLQVVGFS